MANKFDPIINNDVFGNSALLDCLCGAKVMYQVNQKKRINDFIADHRERCTVKNLIERYEKNISRIEKDLNEKKEILEELKKKKEQGYV